MTEPDQIKKRIAHLESENKKLGHIMMLSKLPDSELVDWSISRELAKAMVNTDKIIELKRKLEKLEKQETFTF